MAALAAGVAALEALPADHARPDPAFRDWIADAMPAHGARDRRGRRRCRRPDRWPRGAARWPCGWGTPGASPRRGPWGRRTWPRRRGPTTPTRWCSRGSATRSSPSRIGRGRAGPPGSGAGGVAAGAGGLSRDRPPLPGRPCPRPRVDGGRLALLHDRSRGAARHSSRRPRPQRRGPAARSGPRRTRTCSNWTSSCSKVRGPRRSGWRAPPLDPSIPSSLQQAVLGLASPRPVAR